MRKDPKSTKMTDSLTVFFAILESSHVKAAHKMLVKSTPREQGRGLNLLQQTNLVGCSPGPYFFTPVLAYTFVRERFRHKTRLLLDRFL